MDDQDFEDENIDLSGFSYPEFLAFFFERPVMGNGAYEMFHPVGRFFEVANPGYATLTVDEEQIIVAGERALPTLYVLRFLPPEDQAEAVVRREHAA